MRSFSALILSLALVTACKGPEGPEGPAGLDGTDGEDGQAVLSIDADTTWTEDTEITGYWLVRPGVTLTIEQGVTVTLLPGSGLIVEGTLATGTEGIVFEALSANATNLGVTIIGAATGLDNSSFTSIDLFLEGDGTTSLTGMEFEDSTLWLLDRTTDFALSSSTFRGSYTGANPAVVAEVASEVTVADSSFDGGVQGIDFVGAGPGAVLSVSNSTFAGLGQGVMATGLSDALPQVSLTSIEMEDLTGTALALYSAEATLDDVNITRTNTNGIVGDYNSSLTMANSQITDVRNSCIITDGGVDLTSVDITTCGGLGVSHGPAGGTLQDVTITDIYSNALSSSRGDLSLTNVGISEVRGYGVVLDDGALTVRGLTLAEVAKDGLLISFATVDVDGLTATSLGSRGISLSSTDGSLTNLTLSDMLSMGIAVYEGTVSISSSSVTGSYSSGLNLSVADVTLSDITIDDVQYGINSSQSTVVAERLDIRNSSRYGAYFLGESAGIADSTITLTEYSGIYSSQGSLTVEGTEISDVASHGIQVARGPATITDSQILDAAGRGISSDNSVTLSGTSVQRSASYGIYADELVMSDSEVLQSGSRGIYLTGATASSITNSDIRESAGNGVQGPVVETSNFTVSGSNIVGNEAWGMYGVRVADGNYIADNLGYTAVDTSEDEGGDGSWGIQTTQVKYVDSLTNPSSEEIAGTGPS